MNTDLLSADIHPSELGFLRSIFGLLFVLPVIIRGGVIHRDMPQKKLLIFRGLVGCFATLTIYYAVANVPLADVHVVAWAEGHVIGQKLVVAGDTAADVGLKRGVGRELELQLHGEEVPAVGRIQVQLTLNKNEGMEIRLPAPLREHTLGD